MAIVKDVLRRTRDKFTAGDGCWEWHASLNDGGYGQMAGGPGSSPLRAHRVMYEWLIGPIPDGLVIDHLCRNRACVNPAHMEPVTRGENVKRGVAAEATRARLAAQTHCKRGHEFTPENTYMGLLSYGRGPVRVCRKCKCIRAARQRAGEG